MVYFKHQYIKMQTYTKADAIMAAVQDIMNVLTQDGRSNIEHNDREELIEHVSIFNNVAKTLSMHKAEKESATITNNQVKTNYTPKATNHHPKITPNPCKPKYDNTKSCTYYKLTTQNTKICHMPQQTSSA